MTQNPNRGGGNGCLVAFMLLGVLMVGTAGAFELLADFEFPDVEAEVQGNREWAPEPPMGGAMPVPREVVPEAVVVVPPPPAAVAGPGHSLLWHAEIPGDPPVPCVMRIDVTADAQPHATAVSLECADGRHLSSAPRRTTLTGVGTAHGASLRASVSPSRATDGTGNQLVVSVDSADHQINIIGSSTLPGTLFVDELSVPNPSLTQYGRAALSERMVRLAVPTLVSGPIPTAIAMVRATGRTPRFGDSVCELTAGPNPDSGYNCRLILRCHGEVIYGLNNSGYNDCTLGMSGIVSAQDTGTTAENSDPRIDLDMTEGRLIVSDVSSQGEWSATFDLIDDPRCGADMNYVGSHVAGEVFSDFQTSPLATSPVLAVDGRNEPLIAPTSHCGSSRLEFSRAAEPSVRTSLFFGRGARSIAGHIGPDGDAVWGFAR